MNRLIGGRYPISREFVEVPGGFRRAVEDADPDLEHDGRSLALPEAGTVEA